MSNRMPPTAVSRGIEARVDGISLAEHRHWLGRRCGPSWDLKFWHGPGKVIELSWQGNTLLNKK